MVRVPLGHTHHASRLTLWVRTSRQSSCESRRIRTGDLQSRSLALSPIELVCMLRPLGYAPQKCSRFQVPGLPLRGSAPKGFTLRGPELETWNLELGTQYRQVRDQGKDETRHGTYKFEKLVLASCR